ncbi:uncharacterized protein L199_004820 [Kwoniella botswanensis]|uniref:uncharacterized protein n=1 Tax=Kwoniella botswanensis TaxID=1268659 RepID=UPI00315DE60C
MDLPSGSSDFASPEGSKRRKRSKQPLIENIIDIESTTFTGQITPSFDVVKNRVSIACKSCRSRKVKCLPTWSASDPLEPPGPCKQCIKAGNGNGEGCFYPPSKDRAAFSRQYVSGLEARMEALESMVKRMLPVFEAVEKDRKIANPSPEETYVRQVDEMAEVSDRGDQFALVNSTLSGSRPMQSQIHPSDPSSSSTTVSTHPRPLPANRDRDRPSTAGSLKYGRYTYDDNGKPRWIGGYNTFSILDTYIHSTPTAHMLSSSSSSSASRRFSPTPSFPTDQWRLHASAASPESGGVLRRMWPSLDQLVFPSEEHERAMIDAYYTQVHPILPAVPEHRLRELYEALVIRRKQHDFASAEAFWALIFAIFALGERALVNTGVWEQARHDPSGKHAVKPDAGLVWYEIAETLHYLSCRDVDHFQVQCLTLLAAYQASVNQMPRAWLLAGQAMRFALDMGLHTRYHRKEATAHNRQAGSSLWWTIYGLERLLSLCLGRPPGVEDIDIDARYPACLSDLQMRELQQDSAADLDAMGDEPDNCTMSGFVALTKLCKIAGQVAHLLLRKKLPDSSEDDSVEKAVKTLDKSLEDWFSHDLPAKYKDASPSKAVQQMSAVLSNTFFTIQITLHRHFIFSANTSSPDLNTDALSKCVDTALSMIRVVANRGVLIPPSHHLSIMCQYLWSSGIILLICKKRLISPYNLPPGHIANDINACRRSLAELDQVWPGTRRLRQLLDEVDAVSEPSSTVSLGETNLEPDPAVIRRVLPDEGLHARGGPLLKAAIARRERGDYVGANAQAISWTSPTSPIVSPPASQANEFHISPTSQTRAPSNPPPRLDASSSTVTAVELPIHTQDFSQCLDSASFDFTDNTTNTIGISNTFDAGNLLQAFFNGTGIDVDSFWSGLNDVQQPSGGTAVASEAGNGGGMFGSNGGTSGGGGDAYGYGNPATGASNDVWITQAGGGLYGGGEGGGGASVMAPNQWSGGGNSSGTATVLFSEFDFMGSTGGQRS